MSRRCEVCSKKRLYGANVSHSHRVTTKIQFPNLQKVKAKIGGKTQNIYICAKCLKAGKVELVK